MAWRLGLCLGVNTELVDPNSAFFMGMEYSFTKRDGYFDFKEIQKSQLVPRNDLSMLGGIGGKRWNIGNHLRIQAGLGVEAGSAYDDTLFFNESVIVKYSFFHISFEPVLQFPLSSVGLTRPFFLLGGGVNFLRTSKHTMTLDKSQEILFTDTPWLYVKSNRISVNVTGGFGMDWALSRTASISLWYSIRYWRPVRYNVEDDYIYSPQQYHETFFTHNFNLAALFNFR